MFVEKLTKDDIQHFLGKTLFNPESPYSVSHRDIFNNSSRISILKSETGFQVVWGFKIMYFSDYTMNTLGVSYQNLNKDNYREKINEAWTDYMSNKFGKEYVDAYAKKQQKNLDDTEIETF